MHAVSFMRIGMVWYIVLHELYARVRTHAHMHACTHVSLSCK